MSVIQSLKNIIGDGPDQHTYECTECGAEFESYIDPDDHWVTCSQCDSREVELLD